MNVIVKRRQLIIATLVVALGAAVFVNWYYTGNNNIKKGEPKETEFVQNLGEAKLVDAKESKKNPFDEMKLNRKKTNDEAVDKLNKSLKNVKSGSEEAKKITDSVDALLNKSKKESELENLIKTEIKAESFVTINEKTARVIIEKGKLDEDVALKVFEIVKNGADVPSTGITISEN